MSGDTGTPTVLPERGHPEDPERHDARTMRERLTRRVLWFAAMAFLLFSAIQVDLLPDRVVERIARAQYILGQMLPPRFEEPRSLASAAIESLQVAIVGTVFGILISLTLAILAARNVSPLGPLSIAVKLFAGFVRAIPALLWALLFVIAIGFGPAAGILALAINSTGMLVKIYSETIEEIPSGPIEALRATGAGRVQIALQGVLPHVVGVFIAWSVFRFDINVRYSAVLGLVGAGGIGWEVMRAVNLLRYDAAMGVTFVIFVMVVAMEMLSRWLQRRSAHVTTLM
jgi:phosphonate transport system permease protein